MIRTDGAPLRVRLRMSRLDADPPAVLMTLAEQSAPSDSIEELRETAALFGNIAEHIPGVLFQRVFTDGGGLAYTFVSRAAFDIMGVSAQEIVADPEVVLSCFHPEDRTAHVEALRKSYTELTQYAGDFRYFHPELGLRWLHTISRPRRRADGTIVSEGRRNSRRKPSTCWTAIRSGRPACIPSPVWEAAP